MTSPQARLSGVKGMNDALPQDIAYWERFESVAESTARAYGYCQIRTPMVELTPVFKRAIGEVTDIVEKEMYSFIDALNGEELTLRPEGTAAAVRAVVEHNLLYNGPLRLWYLGPMFRHERPQRGRYRQFHQFGVEALGYGGPDIDAEIILLARRLFEDLGLTGIRLEINSIGQPDERARQRADLVSYFSQFERALDSDSVRRLATNPLRILDSKNPAMQEMIEGAPRLIDYLGEASRTHFEGFQRLLAESGVEFTINPRLVRGLDYYNLTVFEWVSDALGAQGTVCGGGRYDPLIALMGGKPAPACGFAMGIERILDLMRQQAPLGEQRGCDVYVMPHGDAAARVALRMAEDLRAVGLEVIMHCEPESHAASLKAQMKRADASGAAYGLILGEDELASGEVTVKQMRATTTGGVQKRVLMENLVEYLIDEVSGSDEFES